MRFSILFLACACWSAPGPALSDLTVSIKSVAGASGTVVAVSDGKSLFTCATGTCSVHLPNDAVVTLSASPGASSLFLSWSGDCAGTSGSCTLTMKAATAVTGQFRPSANLAFTSTELDMPFGATGDAAQAAADQHCNARAAAAGLPGHYVAWLSTLGTNAISKLGTANGWVRTDGRPFANTQADLVAGKVFYPLVRGETGDDVGAAPFVATGTRSDGMFFADNTCLDWTSTTAFNAGTGVPSGGSGAWTSAPYAVLCTGPFALYCFETSMDTKVVPAATGRYAFLSKGTFKPGGKIRADADAICLADAQNAGLPAPFSDYLALLASSTEAPIARFSIATGSPTWVRPDGVKIVDKAADIVNQRILAPIDVAADGTYVPTGEPWTGSLAPNLPGDLATTCNDWGSTANSGNGGQLEYTFHWFDEYRFSISCQTAERVYCLQK